MYRQTRVARAWLRDHMDIKLQAHLFGSVWRSPGADRTHVQQVGVIHAGVKRALLANLGAQPGVCRGILRFTARLTRKTAVQFSAQWHLQAETLLCKLCMVVCSNVASGAVSSADVKAAAAVIQVNLADAIKCATFGICCRSDRADLA